jgi:cytochrome c oxidase subunit III
MKSNTITQSKRLNLTQTTLFLVLSAETALFGTLVMSYLFLRSGGSETVFTHPQPVDVMIASLNTMVLLASAAFAWNAHRAISQGQLRRLKTYLLLTLLLGAIFFAGQVFEFRHSGMRIDNSVFGAIFFALISFHALHVLAGMTVLGLNYVRAHLGDFGANRHVAVTAGTWFWYYVVAVWIVLFTVLYLV